MFVYHYIFFQPQLKAAHVSVSKLFCLRTRNCLTVTPPRCAPHSQRAVLGLGMAPVPVLFSIQCCSPPNPWASPCHGFLLHSHAAESCFSGLLKKIFEFSEQMFSCLPVSTTVIFLVSRYPGMTSAASPGSLSLCPSPFLSKQSFFPPVPAAHLPQGSRCPHQIGGSCTKGAARLAANSPALEEPWLSKAREECGVPSKSRY